METRKVQLTGGSTFTVSLPKDWAERNGITRGDSVFLKESGDSLTISTSGSAGDREVELDASDDAELERRIIAAYVNGYRVMRVKCSGEEKEAAKRIVSKLMGTEIIEEGVGHLVVEDLLDPFQLDSRNGLKRMHLMSRSMHEDAVRAFGDEEMARDIVRRDDEVDRLYLLIARQFSLLRGDGTEDQFEVLMCARGIERIADHAYKIAQNAAVSRTSEDVELRIGGLSGEMTGLVDTAVAAFHSADPGRANDVFVERERLEEREQDLKKLILGEPTEEAVRTNTILDSLSRSADYATDIAEAAINTALH